PHRLAPVLHRARGKGKGTMSHRLAILLPAVASVLALSVPALAEDQGDFSKVAPEVLSKEGRAEARGMIDRDVDRRTREFNAQHRETWYKVKTREQWEKYRDERIDRLRQSLGEWPRPGKPNIKVTGVVKG